VKYIVLIIDGAAGLPIPSRNMSTCLELAYIPNLDRMAREGLVGITRTVPQGMEPSSGCACMSIMGYDPRIYYKGRSGIEAISMGVPVLQDEVGFRCNLVSIVNGAMFDYSAGHISSDEARGLINVLQEELGSESITFYPGVGYRHLCKIKGYPEALKSDCTPPHDIPNRPIQEYLPQGSGSELLCDLMQRSVDILSNHEINKNREASGKPTANMIWLFWGSGQIPEMPRFKELHNKNAAITTSVDLLRGLAKMMDITILDIPGVTDGPDNDYNRQATDALNALRTHDLIFIHVESPDEAGHAGNIDAKVHAIERVDGEMVSKIVSYKADEIHVLALPDHPTPVEVRTHTSDPVPFILWGPGFAQSGALSFSEAEAGKTGIVIQSGHKLIKRLNSS